MNTKDHAPSCPVTPCVCEEIPKEMYTKDNEEVVLGEDKGSPDGDCTIRGIRHPDGTIEVTKVEHTKDSKTPKSEWEKVLEIISSKRMK